MGTGPLLAIPRLSLCSGTTIDLSLLTILLHLTHPEWTSMGDSSRAKTAETRGTLLSTLARDQIRFHAYHFPFPGIGRVRALADGAYEFVSERWWWEG